MLCSKKRGCKDKDAVEAYQYQAGYDSSYKHVSYGNFHYRSQEQKNILGGMICPRVPEAAMVPAAKDAESRY